MSEFLVNPSGRVVDVDSARVHELKRQGYRDATQTEIANAYPAHVGSGGPSTGMGYDNLTNVKGVSQAGALTNNVPPSPSDAALAAAAQARTGTVLGVPSALGVVQMGVNDAVLRAMSTDREQTLEADLNAAAQSAPSSVSDALQERQQAQHSTDENAEQLRQIAEAAERAQQANGGGSTPTPTEGGNAPSTNDTPPAKLTGKSELPGNFPGRRKLMDAGLTTLGAVADHDWDATPVAGIGEQTRKDITVALGADNIELDA